MASPAKSSRPATIHRWVRRGFLVWAVVSTSWLANTFRTRGVDEAVLQSSQTVEVADRAATLEMIPRKSPRAGLIFLCGAGVSAEAYAPLLRPVAEAGFAVFIEKLPWRLAPLASHKQTAVDRARGLIANHPEIPRWVVSGHSLGAALACRVARADPAAISALVLIGTTHPKSDDLSFLQIPVTKVYGSNDGVAPRDRVLANRSLLPATTKWIEIEGANHSQFGHYGHQLLDGKATIRREVQQERTRAALLEALEGEDLRHTMKPGG